MGNNLSGLNPHQSVNVEQVLVDSDDWKHEKILGNSRFFKVSKIKLKKERKSGVLKVFKFSEGSKSIAEKYLSIIQSYCFNNPNITNVLPYSKCFINKDVAFLLRDYSHYSLNERISTRPFLTIVEKKWIAFQILCGLTQCHKERLGQHYQDIPTYFGSEGKLCHGDLKTENIMLTDWGWVFLTDMAPFKPTYLPANNPGEFYFFFDVSGKRACYLAPERFIDMSNTQKVLPDSSASKSTSSKKTSSSDLDSNDAVKNVGSVDVTDQFKNIIQPSMDMFSTGCIFIELFTDGIVPFNLAELFNYRNNDQTKLNSLLLKIRDTNIQKMIRQLLQISPQERITAEECLVSQRGLSFPDIFYRDLKGYMVQFLQESLSNPDVRVNKLFSDFPELMKTYLVKSKSRNLQNGNLVLFVNLITSSIFSLEEEQSKINCLIMLKELGLYMTDDLVLDRIVPFLIEFIDADHSIECRRTALDCLVLSVVDINPCSPSDISFFPDYLLPAICDMQSDLSVTIRHSFANHIPCLAKASHRFLKKCIILQKVMKKTKETIDYEDELTHLREIFRENIILLFSEPDVFIKCCVAQPQYLQDLSDFFSISHSVEILVSHLITFVNDKTNYVVRCAFYGCIPDLIKIMGVQSLKHLHSLLVQGLQDSQLQVVEICCHSLSKMIRMKLMPHWLSSKIFPIIVSLLALPYNSIRLTALDYIISFFNHSPCSTVYTSFLNSDEDGCIFKSKDFIYTQDHLDATTWDNLLPPLSRAVFEDIIRSSLTDSFFSLLNDHKIKKTHSSNEDDVLAVNLYNRLQDMGMTSNNELQIIFLRKLILEIVSSKRSNKQISTNNGKPNQNVSAFNTPIEYYTYKSTTPSFIPTDLVPEAISSIEFDTSLNKEFINDIQKVSDSKKFSQQPLKDGTSENIWENLFDSLPSDTITNSFSNTKIIVGNDNFGDGDLMKQDMLEWPFKSMDNNKFKVAIHRGLTCGTHHVKSDHISKIKNHYLPTAWKPKGILVGHLHEHRRGYTSILAHPTDKQIISSGADKSVKFWNCDPNPGKADPTCSKYIPNKSSLSVQLVNEDFPKDSPYESCQKLVWTEDNNSVAVVVDRKFTYIIDRNGEKKKVFDFPVEKYGYIRNLVSPAESGCELDVASERTLIYSTTGNWIVAHDTRCPSPVGSIWSHKQHNDYGFITCLTIHSSYTWMVAGTSRGSLVCWDLRFQRVVNKINHPNTSGFLSLQLNPLINDNSADMRTSQIWAATEEANEISSWNLESNCQVIVLKTLIPQVTSSIPNEVLSIKRKASINSVLTNNYNSKAFSVKLIGSVEQRPCILSGSSDCHLRYWDLSEPSQSSVLSIGGLDQYSSEVTSLYNTFTDNTNTCVIEEQQKINFNDENLKQKRNFQPFTGHVSNICEVTTVSLGQPFLVSSSMDGIIKLWK